MRHKSARLMQVIQIPARSIRISLLSEKSLNTGALVNASSDRIMAAIIGGGGISAQNVSNRLNSFATAYGINSF